MSEWITTEDTWLSEAQSLNNAQIVASFFGLLQWTPQAIAALCGNMRHESSINPNIWEYGYNHSFDRGYGLVQWTPASKYIDWAIGQGYEWQNGTSQLQRIQFEKENGLQWIAKADYNHMTFHEFALSSESVGYLTPCFTWSYERPNQTAGEQSMPARIAFAERVLNEIDFSLNTKPPGQKADNMIFHLWLSGALKGWS